MTGCGSAAPPFCSQVILAQVSPASAGADHAAASPANQVQFAITGRVVQGRANAAGCIAHPLAQAPVWTSSDPVDAPIVSTPDGGGLATCLNPTLTPVTIGVTQQDGEGNIQGTSGTVTLSCR